MGGVEVVEAELKVCEVLFVFNFYLIDQRFWRSAVVFCTEHDRCAMSIICPNPGGVVATKSLETRPDISLNVLDHVAQMNRPVRVRQGTGDQDVALPYWIHTGRIHTGSHR